ncbi:MAG: chromosome segregation protein SMC, partial [Lachnospiraceae bacterium]|nr:chromosome segregation protein SMC [Lachnospiraceae bacterium]
MYLKSIEVHGFKSFANKINFKFNSGITAIVGPNGSGKSNVADAVRWVLGEQSAKQLRGSKMEDVIFSGTQLRKPMSYAYVAITFDNSDRALNIDYEEVTVARRVYRSGESEYLMNGASCRLRDVQELFFDTGIGKEGYSIIGQGQIDKILSGKPEDRRELFDEAAGIVKFKKRKAAAEKELEEEKLNLSRITDILSEIEKQVGPLKEQSEVAKEYLRLKEELKKFEINLFLADYEKNEASREESLKKQALVNSDIESAKTAYEKIKNEYERLEEQINEYSEKIEKEKETKSKLLIDQEKKDGEIKLMEEQKNSLFKSNAHYEQRKNAINSELEKRDEGIAEQHAEAEKVKQKIEDLKKSGVNSENEINGIKERIKDISNEIAQCNEFLIGLLNDDTKVKTELSRLNTLNEQNAIKKAELTKKVLSQKNFENEYETAVETYNRELSEIAEKMEELSASVSSKEAEAAKLKERLEETQGFLDRFQKEKIELDSKAGTLADFSERYEGYGLAIKKVMERKAYLPGIVGVVADIIEVEKKYETAVETALGGSIQNIVTKDEPTAKKLIEYLKENKFGRATFLPLDAITAKDNNDDLSGEEGFIGYANKLVKTDKTFNVLMKHLLGRIVVCDNMTNALKLAKKYHYSLRIVTLEGELLTPGGSISGGAFKNNSNLLGRKRELDEAKKKSDEIQIKINALTRERDSYREKRNRLREEAERAKEELKKLEIRQNLVSLNLKKEEERIKESKQSYSVIELEIKELEKKTTENNEAAKTQEERLSDNERLRAEANEKIEGLNHR